MDKSDLLRLIRLGRESDGGWNLHSSSGALDICVGEDDKTPPSTFVGGAADRPALLMFKRAPKNND